MKQFGQFIALICGQTSFIAWGFWIARFCESVGLPSIIEFVLCAGTIVFGLWCCIKLMRMAEQAESCEEDLSHALRQTEFWLSAYRSACNELEEKEEELQKTEEELFDLQQAYSELGQAYNELRDKLLENGIDPDCPV